MTATFGNIAPKSMALQKSVHFFGQLSANPFSRSNLLNTCLPETIHRPKSPQQQILPVLTHTRAIIENALFDAFLHEQLMVRVGKPVGLVANALKQPQSRRIHWKSQRQRPARPVDLFAFFRQADDGKLVHT
jgi:hypothetical protein